MECLSSCAPGDDGCVQFCEAMWPDGPYFAADMLDCLACGPCHATCAELPVSCAPPAACGNGALDPGEVCYGALLGGHGCVELGMIGTLGCAWDCLSLDFSGCNLCGNGRADLDRGEACDGGDLAGQSCQSQGLLAGQLACLPGCAGFDLSGCVGCGNGRLEAGEFCDGSYTGALTCADLGLGDGPLGCTPDCLHVATGGCQASYCDGSGDCTTCQTCADEGACRSARQACVDSAECMTYNDCLFGCMDQACIDACAITYPQGAALYHAYVDCIVCQSCLRDCAGAGSCQPDPLCGNGALDPDEVCDPTAPLALA
jgi:hypothetical protein